MWNCMTFTISQEMKQSAVSLKGLIETHKERMWWYFTYKNTHNYLKVLPKPVKSYNQSAHSSIKMKPVDVNINNQYVALNALYGKNWINMDDKTKSNVQSRRWCENK